MQPHPALGSGRHLVVMQGAPGSGKSTVAKSLLAARGLGIIFSPDNFWERKGEYTFIEALRHIAHGWNEKRALKHMEETNAEGLSDDLVIIDSTNATRSVAKRYAAPAILNGYTVHTFRVDPGLEECQRRNALRPANRRVPNEQVAKMHGGMKDLTLLDSVNGPEFTPLSD